MEHALPRRTAGTPRTWALCMTSENHGTVGKAGDPFSHAPGKHERVQVVEIVAAGTPPAPDVDLAGLVRIDVADLVGKLDEVHTWARNLPIPTRGASSAMRKVSEVKDALATIPVAAQAGHDDDTDVTDLEVRDALGDQYDPDVGEAVSVLRVMAAWKAESELGEKYKQMALGAAQAGQVAVPEDVARDAERYRWLRDRMSFTDSTEPPTMKLRAPLPALDHDFHKDWVGDRFDASVDRAIDAAIQASTSGEHQEGGAA